jgi:hypothetical protein
VRVTRPLLALPVAVLLAGCGGATAPRVYQPSASPQPLVRSGGFTLEITSPRDTWEAGEPIEVTATLTYLGAGSTAVWGAGSGPIAFGVREIGGTREMGALLTADCEAHEIGPGLFVAEYGKSGGWGPDDPNAAFYQEFFGDPEFRLPAGRWEITAWARFATEECGPYTVDTRAGLVLLVE